MDEDGSAALEFIAVGVILLVPLTYLVIALAGIQEQTLGVEAAARHVARAVAQAPDAAAAAAYGDAVLAGLVDEYGLDADAVDLSFSCTPSGVTCPSPGAVLTVDVDTRVRLPLVPDVFGLAHSAAVPVHAEAVQKVSRLWGER
ncbi:MULTISPECIES: TadE family protein [unclassified Microbacterium]|uniref:TadE family protein n=1 Tax=unclassified Microbacterium TaxID=2609290 RepID=UPI001FCECB54|nr:MULTISPECIES: TadE family protein [unclassified Microbacterium]